MPGDNNLYGFSERRPIGPKLTMQYIPVTPRVTGMYCKK